jgi:hypothetical protein
MNKIKYKKPNIIKLVNLTINLQQSTYDDNKDIIWPTSVRIFVVLILGSMICRYQCSSKERSPYIVQNHYVVYGVFRHYKTKK